MKKILLGGLIALATAPLAATPATASDDYVEPLLWEGAYTVAVSGDGRYVAAQNLAGECFVRDVTTGREYEYQSVYNGDSNCLSDNGILVGEDIDTGKGVIMYEGRKLRPAPLDAYPMSCFEGITPDGSLAVGYVMDGSTQLPMVYDLDRNRLTLLPYPETDADGDPAQGAACHAVSDDGSVIAGIYVNGTGFAYAPVAFIRDDAGEWSCLMPDMTPYGENYFFGGMMAVSPDGSKIMTARAVPNENDPASESYLPYELDVERGELFPVETSLPELLPSQILEDGTIIGTTSGNAFFPWTSYIRLPGADDFISFADFLKDYIPQYYPWLEDTLGMYGIIGYDEDGKEIYGFYITTGRITVSRGLETIAGGLPIDGFLSYIYRSDEGFDIPSDGVETVTASQGVDEEGAWYDLNGIRVADPESGIFIHNRRLVKK